MNFVTPTNMTRQGISIIEVLTSIVVAMIGVFGVMILIPFAVKQAKTGLDRDAATIAARNAFAQFDINGYRRVEIDRNDTLPSATFNEPVFNWFNLNPADGSLIKVRQQPAMPEVPQILSIDPLGVTENNGNYATTTFPFNLGMFTPATGAIPYPTGGPNGLTIPVANMGVPAYDFSSSVPMGRAAARRMFRAVDELVFGEPISAGAGSDPALNGPQQEFDRSGTIELRRQSIGSISWSAIVVPFGENNTALKYNIYVLVYKDRVTDVTAFESRMRTAQVIFDPPGNIPNFDDPVSTVLLATDPAPDVSEQPDSLAEVLRKDDWVMLINKNNANPENLSETQVGFYRVVNFDNTRVTVDGPNFDFTTAAGETHFVHLKDVVGVYERSFTPEGSSNWNSIY